MTLLYLLNMYVFVNNKSQTLQLAHALMSPILEALADRSYLPPPWQMADIGPYQWHNSLQSL